ncbi:type I toxin-antitoxin system toxin Ldr family protein [Citrobacter portucalensis]|nr:type I toxin-antitoxin system toxin Ldr family protein [Citrobacter portucalensis]MCX8981138.1 type I toxin-antitoxin system toxin Ldr family protein [Citrobacter portucalensis]
MSLAQIGLSVWQDLAAPVIAGVLTSLIVAWIKRKR